MTPLISSSLRVLTGALFLCVPLLTSAPQAAAAPGDLDLSFGGTGRVTAEFRRPGEQSQNSQNRGSCVAIQADGKAIIAGSSYRYGTRVFAYFAAARFNPDGTPDTSFGNKGEIYINPDEKEKLGSGSCSAIAIQKDGKIILAGTSGRRGIVLVRSDATGVLDKTFGAGGIAIVEYYGEQEVSKVVVQEDGKILVSGNASFAGNTGFVVARFHADGRPDAEFGSGNGIAPGVNEESNHDICADMALQDGGKILLVGYSLGSLSASSVLLMRFNPDGTLDDSFGSKGKVRTPADGGIRRAHGVKIQRDGKIVLGGIYRESEGTSGDVLLLRYDANGVLDGSFGEGGATIHEYPGRHDGCSKIALDEEGRIVVAGGVSDNTDARFLVARFHPDGTPDSGFGDHGRTITQIGTEADSGLDVALQQDGKILLAGHSRSRDDYLFRFSLLRYLDKPQPTLTVTGASTVTATAATLEGVANADENPGRDAQGIEGLSFEVSSDGGVTYFSLPSSPAAVVGKEPVAVSGELSGLTPGTAYRCRLRGVAAAGTVLTGEEFAFTTLTLHQNWRQSHFGSPEGTGDGADASDPDGDGLPNLLEWAAGSDPKAFSASPATVSRSGGETENAVLEFTYSRSVPAKEAGAVFTVEWTDDPAAGPWSVEGVTETMVPEESAIQRVKALVPAGESGRRFVRLKVTTPP